MEENKAILVTQEVNEVASMKEPSHKLDFILIGKEDPAEEDSRENSFVFKMKVKLTSIDVTVDTRSLKNLIYGITS